MNCGDTPADPAEPRVVGHLRPRHREPEPARLRRPLPRQAGASARSSGATASCPASTRARHIDNADARPEDGHRAHPQHATSPRDAQREQLDLLQRAERDAPGRPRRATPQLEARIQSFELAFRMQTEAPDAFDVEPGAARRPATLYGKGDFADACLHRPPARRARRAVRAGLLRRRPAVGRPRRHREAATAQGSQDSRPGRSPRCSRDLKRRGLLDDTLVLWGGEFGRTPTSEGAQRPRPQPPRLHACGWPAAASRAA